MAKPQKKTIINLSDHKLSPTEEFVLSHGLNFCLPPNNIKREEIFAEFEVLFGQLLHHVPHTPEQFSALKAKLSDLAHAYCGTPVDIGDFLILKECIQAGKSLRSNENIHVTKPDKGSGVVILNKSDYISKMEFILQDSSKFKTLGSSAEADNTTKIEAQIQRRLLQLKKEGLLPADIYNKIRPTGSQRPRMYGLPKIHKKDVPLRPILSMTGSAQHQLAQWLSSVIDPVLSLYSSHCISDSFTFADAVRNFNFSSSVFLCSYDVVSLFTNVPLTETIDICANALYNGELSPPPFPRDVFVELMQKATSSVEFSFNNIMHQQVDGVAMGSPLGPSLANIFVGYHEALLFKRVNKPLMYYRYVDDTFTVFSNEADCNDFLTHLNSLHPSLRFTFEKESNHSLPFLDVLVEKKDHQFITSVYRKPTFTGQYVRWNSFCPKKRKLNLISTLVHRALVICSKSTLQKELSNIRSILLDNGYPKQVINTAISKKIVQFQKPAVSGPKKCPVYLHLPWLGNVSTKFEMQIKTAVKRCYFAVEPNIIFKTRQLLPATKKDVLPTCYQSNIIYEFVCHCDSRYVGRTSQRLQQRINQHIPKSVINKQNFQNRMKLARSCKPTKSPQPEISFSAIGQHLLENPSCAKEYNDQKFSILARGRTAFHLSTLEATYIKTTKPDLCKQKEFVYGLKITH